MVRLFVAPLAGGKGFVVAAEFSNGGIAPITLPGSAQKARRLLAALAMVAGLDVDEFGLRASR